MKGNAAHMEIMKSWKLSENCPESFIINDPIRMPAEAISNPVQRTELMIDNIKYIFLF